MLLNIIFSFNRALQLDYLLNSTLKHFKLDYKIVVIYHTTGPHKEGYDKLINDYSDNNQITFLEREPRSLNLFKRLFLSKSFKNDFLKHDNFKFLLESVIRESGCKYVMFNTDDGYWRDDFYLSYDVKNLIDRNPYQVTYRLYVGENLDEIPHFVKKWGEYYLWDYYYEERVTHWTFPFAVDGTIYNSIAILDTIKFVEYHNPVTLEDYVVSYVKNNNLFSIGLSPIHSLLVCTKLNRVSTETKNPTIHISTELLNKYFLEGYNLKLKLPELITNANIVPIEVDVIRENEIINIYKLDEFGILVQNNLGIEGAKTQMD